MIVLELFHWEWTLTEAAFPIAKLAIYIVAPVVEATVVQCGEAVALTAGNGCDVQRFHLPVNAVVHLTDVLYKHPVLQVTRPIDS